MLKRFACFILTIYQKYFRFILPVSCRFVPSCSEYTKQAIQKYGFIKGALKGFKRLLICQPFSRQSGYDPLV